MYENQSELWEEMKRLFEDEDYQEWLEQRDAERIIEMENAAEREGLFGRRQPVRILQH